MLMFLQILTAFQNGLVYFLHLYKTIIELLKVKITLKVGYLLVVYYEECDFKMFVFCIISSYKCFFSRYEISIYLSSNNVKPLLGT